MKTVYMKEMVRRAYHREGKSHRQIARELGLDRRTVKKLLDMQAEEIPQYKLSRKKARPILGPYLSVIEQWLKEDEEAPRKQRHTAKRLHMRLQEEYDFKGGYSTVRDYLKQVRNIPKEVFLPLAFAPGEMGQVDWGEVQAMIGGIRLKLQLFGMVLNESGAHFVQAFSNQNQESFFEGHQNSFSFFGGVPQTVTYDNLTSAVSKILGRERLENKRFVAFRSGYLFKSRFCNPARGNEKGRIENVVKYAQRNYFTPVPEFESLEALNAFLQEKCLAYQEKRQARQRETVKEKLEKERAHLLPLPNPLPQCCRIVCVKADKSALVQFETNRYSVPSEYAYKSLWLKSFVNRLEITYEDKLIASHSRLQGKFEERIQLMHYQKALERKPGAAQHMRATESSIATFPLSKDQQKASENSPYPKVYVQPPDIQKYAQLLSAQEHSR